MNNQNSQRGAIKPFLPIVVGVLLAIPLGFGAFFLFEEAVTRANATAPMNVSVSKITHSTALITWITDQESIGTVEYGTSPKELGTFAPEAAAKTSHIVELSLLKPQTTYYFVIRIGDRVYNDNGVPWKFTTKSEGDLPDTSVEVLEERNLRLPTPRNGGSICPVTDDCAEIRSLLGSGCSTEDFIRCQQRGGEVQGSSTQRDTASAFPSPTPPRKIDKTAKDRAVVVSPQTSKNAPTYVPPDIIR